MKKRAREKESADLQFITTFKSHLVRIVGYRYTPAIVGAAYLIITGAISFRYHRVLDFGVESDFLFEYVPLAKRVAEGVIPIGEYRGPVYPILLAMLKPITRDFFGAGLVISLLSAATT